MKLERFFTQDRSAESPGFFTVESVGATQKLTPEGFLLCEAVPIARTGVMKYGPYQTPIAPGPDGYVWIERDGSEIFSPATMASAVGKSVVDNHPQVDVSPLNWRQLTVGVVMNVRRGTGEQEDLLLADLLITDQNAIEAVRLGKREVSMGYDCGYRADDQRPGWGWQENIIFNHCALVESGRCGQRCSIGDDAKTETRPMSLQSIRDRILGAFASKDEKAMLEALDQLPAGSGTSSNVHIHVGRTRDEDEPDDKKDGEGKDTKGRDKARDEEFEEFKKETKDSIEKLSTTVQDMKRTMDEHFGEKEEKETKDEQILGALKFEAPPGTNDAALKSSTKDSAILEDSFQETIALAEVLAPGYSQVPTYDRSAPAHKTFDAMCSFRRRVLDLAYGTAEGRNVIDAVTGGRTLDTATMDCKQVGMVFRAAGGMRKAMNNAATHDRNGGQFSSFTPAARKGPIKSIADLNEYNRKHFAKQ